MPNESGEVTIVPSVHFSPEHRRKTRDTIREVEPDVVAVELDDRRFEQVEEGEEGMMNTAEEMPGNTPQGYAALKAIQEKVVKMHGLDPEETEMETAIETAAALDTDIALIDEDITEIFGQIRERVGLETIPKVLMRAESIDREDLVTRMQDMDMTEVESGDDVEDMMAPMRELLPEVTELLIDRRDEMMAKRLHKIRQNGYDVVAVIGAGHHSGITEHLERLEETDADPDVDVPIRQSQQDVHYIPIND